MDAILVVEEKHGTYYYDASDDEALAKSALKILTDRLNDGYWYHSPDKLWDDNSSYTVTLKQLMPDFDYDASSAEQQERINKYVTEVIEVIPDVDAQKLMKDKLRRAIKSLNDRKAYTEWYNEMLEIVKNQDWQAVFTFKNGRTEPKAWRLLAARSDHEYESVEIESLQPNDLTNS